MVPLHAFTYADYVALEGHSPVRHEFVAGEIYAKAGGTPEHAALAATVLRMIGNQLPAGCRTYTSDLRARIEASNVTSYPDGAVICGKVVPATDDPLAATNPLVLVEVTSPSTEAYDRGLKCDQYKLLASLRHVVIVAHARRSVTVLSRAGEGWTEETLDDQGEVVLAGLGVRIELAAVYEDLA